VLHLLLLRSRRAGSPRIFALRASTQPQMNSPPVGAWGAQRLQAWDRRERAPQVSLAVAHAHSHTNERIPPIPAHTHVNTDRIRRAYHAHLFGDSAVHLLTSPLPSTPQHSFPIPSPTHVPTPTSGLRSGESSQADQLILVERGTESNEQPRTLNFCGMHTDITVKVDVPDCRVHFLTQLSGREPRCLELSLGSKLGFRRVGDTQHWRAAVTDLCVNSFVSERRVGTSPKTPAHHAHTHLF
jgi:hypothetical protein